MSVVSEEAAANRDGGPMEAPPGGSSFFPSSLLAGLRRTIGLGGGEEEADTSVVSQPTAESLAGTRASLGSSHSSVSGSVTRPLDTSGGGSVRVSPAMTPQALPQRDRARSPVGLMGNYREAPQLPARGLSIASVASSAENASTSVLTLRISTVEDSLKAINAGLSAYQRSPTGNTALRDRICNLSSEIDSVRNERAHYQSKLLWLEEQVRQERVERDAWIAAFREAFHDNTLPELSKSIKGSLQECGDLINKQLGDSEEVIRKLTAKVDSAFGARSVQGSATAPMPSASTTPSGTPATVNADGQQRVGVGVGQPATQTMPGIRRQPLSRDDPPVRGKPLPPSRDEPPVRGKPLASPMTQVRNVTPGATPGATPGTTPGSGDLYKAWSELMNENKKLKQAEAALLAQASSPSPAAGARRLSPPVMQPRPGLTSTMMRGGMSRSPPGRPAAS